MRDRGAIASIAEDIAEIGAKIMIVVDEQNERTIQRLIDRFGKNLPKLCLEDGSMRRVGSVNEGRVDVRLLAATNRNMAEEVKAGRFREDLYYRINVMSLQLPPLRARTGDDRLLARHFLGARWQIDTEAMQALERYDWPGNIRQLVNVIERAKILAADDEVLLEDLPGEITCPDRSYCGIAGGVGHRSGTGLRTHGGAARARRRSLESRAAE